MKSVKNGLSGIVVGLIFFAIGICMLWFNEGNNVKNIKAVNEGRKVAVDIANTPVNAKNNGKLVALSGKLNILSGPVVDETFNVSVASPKLLRVVEMYQWEEVEDNDSDGDTSYSYKKVWQDELIDSSSFYYSDTHQNPTSMPYPSTKILATEVKIGDFIVADNQKDMLATDKSIDDLSVATIPVGYSARGAYITTEVEETKVGDVRISFVYSNAQEASIIGQQKDNMIIDYTTKSGKQINSLQEGIHNASAMLDTIEKNNNLLKWALRFFGWLLLLIGIGTLFRPIEMLANIIPIFGKLVGAITGVFSFLLATIIALFTISIAWIFYRPLIGIGLLVVVTGLIILMVKSVKKKTATPAVATTPVPPVNPPVQ